MARFYRCWKLMPDRLMSDYEVTLVNDNSKLSSYWGLPLLIMPLVCVPQLPIRLLGRSKLADTRQARILRPI